jgi:mannose/fructose-specific phosphotransferase system component IIA
MFGIILVTHGDMASGIIDAAMMIYGQPEDRNKTRIEVVALKEGESPQMLLDELSERIEKLKNGGVAGVLILADLFGSSTTTAGTRILLAKPGKQKAVPIAVVSGLNLPMLLELMPALDKSASIEEVAKLAVEAGRKGIINMADEIADRKRSEKWQSKNRNYSRKGGSHVG